MTRHLISTISGLAIGLLVATTPARADEQETYEYLNLFARIFERVRHDYVEEVNDVELIQAAIRGMLGALDPHSAYLDPDSFSDTQVRNRGSFGGLGIEITQEDGFVKVVSPIDDTPAARAGLAAGDFVTHINGESIFGLTLQESIDLMRGEVGSTVQLTIARKGVDPFDVEITRDVIRIRAVRQRAEGDVGYLRITTFSQGVADDLARAFSTLREEIGPGNISGYVLDLRNNPGGLLQQAVAVADVFLERGEIVSTRGRDSSDIERFNASPGDLSEGLPVAVLVNGGSASASEIVAGALQDHRRGVIVGTNTFGKGSVQTIAPVGDKGALQLTTARYYTPSGRSIQGSGVFPDVIVEPIPTDPESAEAELEARADENDRRGSFDSNRSELDLAEDERERERATLAAELRRRDNQLAHAIDLIHTISIYR